jgi:hypothetical protein
VSDDQSGGEGDAETEATSDEEQPRQLRSAAEQLAGTVLVPLNELPDDFQRRAYESLVIRMEQQAHEGVTAAQRAEDDKNLRKGIATWVFTALGAQVVVADSVFLIYAIKNGWDISPATMQVWLGATVVQVVAVALAITKSLFPPKDDQAKA